MLINMMGFNNDPKPGSYSWPFKSNNSAKTKHEHEVKMSAYRLVNK